MCASQYDAVCAPGQLRNDTSPPRDRRTDASAASASWNGSFVPASIQTGTRSKRPWRAAARTSLRAKRGEVERPVTAHRNPPERDPVRRHVEATDRVGDRLVENHRAPAAITA